jgi:hypothetical protein
MIDSRRDVLEMKQDVLTLAKEADLFARKGVNTKTVDLLSLVELKELIHVLASGGTRSGSRSSRPLVMHSASSELGGGGDYCSALECRRRNLLELSRFSLMASDCVYVRNFFSRYKHSDFSKHSHSALKQCFIEDLSLLCDIKPLLQRGFMKLQPEEAHFCPTCLEKVQKERGLPQGLDRKLKREFARLVQVYREHMTVSFEKSSDGYYAHIECPEPFLEHGTGIVISELPEDIRRMPRLSARIESGETVELSKLLRKKSGFASRLADKMMRSVTYNLFVSRWFDTSLVTRNPLEASVLDSFEQRGPRPPRNHLAAKYLTCTLPFLEDVNIKDLMKLRGREEEAFVSFRAALATMTSEFINQREEFRVEDAKQLYADVIAPRLSELEQRIKIAKQDLVHAPRRSALGFVGALSFGLFSGLVPDDLKFLAGFGSVKFGADFLSALMAVGDAEKTIKNHELYFLWRVKKKSRRRANKGGTV